MKPDQRFFEQLSGKEYDFHLKNEDEIERGVVRLNILAEGKAFL